MLHTTGEEILTDHFAGERSQPPSPWYVGLYNDAIDQLVDDDTYAAIETEPTTGYDGPTTVEWPGDMGTEQLDAGSSHSGVYVLDVTARIAFDVAGAVAGEDVIDSYYVAADFRSDRLGQASETRNLLWTGRVDETYDLGDDVTETFPLEGVRHGVD